LKVPLAFGVNLVSRATLLRSESRESLQLKPRGFFLKSGTATLYTGDAITQLRKLPDKSCRCCVTSPPYYGLRDYNSVGQIGLEQSLESYIAKIVAVFREVHHVLRDDGTLWLNLGDSYAGNGIGWQMPRSGEYVGAGGKAPPNVRNRNDVGPVMGAKPKDLLMIPARIALALQADGWYLRSDIIWHKPNPMPESVTDRPTSSHEHVFLLAKKERYFFDAEAVREAAEMKPQNRFTDGRGAKDEGYGPHRQAPGMTDPTSRNIRDVWTIATSPYPGTHFATFPPKLAELCVKAGSKEGDSVLDPFSGSGTTGLVAGLLGRHSYLIDLNPDYISMAQKRLSAERVEIRLAS
jgi:DNA modification methylase